MTLFLSSMVLRFIRRFVPLSLTPSVLYAPVSFILRSYQISSLPFMGSARNLLARSLPPLLFVGGTVNPSISPERISAELLHPWPSFSDEIMVALQGLELSAPVCLTDAPEDERFVVGNELGLTARFIRNVCDPVTKAFSVSSLSNLRFGDIHSVKLQPASFPDVIVLGFTNALAPVRQEGHLLVVGELKTFWTVELEQYPVTSTLMERRNLEHPIGKCS
jgi:hypothetical protein